MSKFRWGMGLAVAMLVAGVAFAEDGLKSELADIRAKLAAQESAVMAPSAGGEAEGIISLKKNAVVKIGGLVNVRYFNRNADIKYVNLDNGGMNTVSKVRESDLRVTDARLIVDAKVNDMVGAFFEIELTASGRGIAGGGSRVANGARYGVDSFEAGDNARQAYIYFTNICDSGFGLNVGRTSVPFGMNVNPGVLATLSASGRGDSYTEMGGGVPAMGQAITIGNFAPGAMGFINPVVAQNGGYTIGNTVYTRVNYSSGAVVPFYGVTDHKRANQITPYWENKAKTFKAELALLQIDNDVYAENPYGYWGPAGWSTAGLPANSWYTTKYKTSDYGLQSGSLRLTWKPIEGLTLGGSLMNWHSGNDNGTAAQSFGQTGIALAGPGGAYNRLFTSGMGGAASTLGNLNAAQSAYWKNSIYSDNYTFSSLGFDYRPACFKKLRVWSEWVHGWNYEFTKGNSSDAITLGVQYFFTEAFNMFLQGDYVSARRDGNNINPTWGNFNGPNNVNAFNAGYDKYNAYSTYVGAQYQIAKGVMAELGWRHEWLKWKGLGSTLAKASADDVYAHVGIVF